MVSERHPFGLYEGDLKTKLKAAFSDFVTISLDIFKQHAEEMDRQVKRSATSDDIEDDHEVVDAAILLGVNLDATAEEIRSALRRRLAASRAHPDQGGDCEKAMKLIAAQNLLLERLKGDDEWTAG